MPDSVRAEIFADDALVLSEEELPTAGTQAARIFVTERADMEAKLTMLRPLLQPDGFIWVSWPKRRPKFRPTSPKIPSALSSCHRPVSSI